MVTPPEIYETSQFTKIIGRHKTTSFISDGIAFLSGALVALLFVWSLWSFANPNPNPNSSLNFTPSSDTNSLKCAGCDSAHSFYDDPAVTYLLENPIKDWDEKRRQWLDHHPSYGGDKVLLVTGSQPSTCRYPIGDHLLLRMFKNKVDYCRIHGYDIFYNNALLNPKMFTFWAKYPVVRAAMVAHPEAEWIWWVDSDAAITDMDFKLPLRRYSRHNLVVHGWPRRIYDHHSWVGLNAGVFLIRNCQWSMEFLAKWASMGPQSPDYDKWGEIQRSVFTDKMFPESDDQTGLAYLMVKEKEKWGDKIYIENEYYFEGYWLEIVPKLDNITAGEIEIEKSAPRPRRRRAEKAAEEEEEKETGRPFITHFTGCQPCSGVHNEMYTEDSCKEGMVKALNFADNQVLRNFGCTRLDLKDDSLVTPIPFDYPASK